ncbi:hypothetical protein ACFO3J_25400 [Streptomyces polygonati]|uniref:Uncharacterized protein n=1 Tax=Streptomyces polygonati TaxID=1617087 RepID=A0ABV8HS07_9ACTN
MRNALGTELTAAQEELADVYRAVRHLVVDRADELAPYEARNAMKALACLWQIVNGLDLEPEQLYRAGV